MSKKRYQLLMMIAMLVVGLDARVLTITWFNKTDRPVHCWATSERTGMFRLEPSGFGGYSHSYSVILLDSHPFNDKIFFRPLADCKTSFAAVERSFSLLPGSEPLEITYFMCFNKETGSFDIQFESQIAPRRPVGVTE